jgi:tellurium resistance protein TerD
MSSFNLEKGSKYNLTKDNDKLHTIRAELSWVTPEGAKPEYDLDVSLFGLTATPNGPKLLKDDYFVFYNHDNKKDDNTPIDTFDGAITKSPDELTGGVEWIKVRLPQVDAKADELSFVITIHKAKERNQTFATVEDAKIEIFNDDTGDLLCCYKLDEAFPRETAVQIGSLVRQDNSDWIFEAVGAGYELGLSAFIEGYTS